MGYICFIFRYLDPSGSDESPQSRGFGLDNKFGPKLELPIVHILGYTPGLASFEVYVDYIGNPNWVPTSGSDPELLDKGGVNVWVFLL